MSLPKKLHYFLIITSTFLLVLSCQNNKYNCAIDKLEIVRNDSIISTKNVKQFQNYLNDEFKEPILQNNKNESYRISIFNAFGRSKSIYRIYKSKKSYTVVFKRINSILDDNSNFIDSTMVTKHAQITKEEWNRVKRIFNENCFWTISTSPKEMRIVKDGAVYFIEANKPNQKNSTHRNYHFSFRNTPKESSFKTICDEFTDFVYYKIHLKN